jgi:ATP-dependent Lhr-like helicase
VGLFHPAVDQWFHAVFAEATAPQKRGWPPIARGDSTLILAPTGSGKTLTAFLWSLNRLMFEPVPERAERCRVLYISPLKALAVDVERNLRAPLAGISNIAAGQGIPFHSPTIAVRTGDTPAAERAKFQKTPADILITTPESLFLLLTSNAHESLRSVETVIIDEIHALVSTKRGAHLSLSLERLERIVRKPGRRSFSEAGQPLQRIGLSATQRPLDEVARYLGGATVTIPSTRDSRASRANRSLKARAPKGDFAESVHAP